MTTDDCWHEGPEIIEVPEVYDGALYFRCRHCGYAWPRFAAPDYRYYAAAKLIAQDHHDDPTS